MPSRFRLAAAAYRQLCEAVRTRADYRCELCQKTKPLQVHHIRPRSQGGGDVRANLVSLCPDCHCLMDGGGWRHYETMLRGRAAV